MSATNSFESVITVTGVAGGTRVEGLMMNFDVAPVLIKEEVASSLLDEFARQTGRRPDSAQCAGSLEGRAGNTVDCTVVTGQDTASYTLTVSGVSARNINYSYAPRPQVDYENSSATADTASSMIARMACSAASSSRSRIARATWSCSSIAAGFGTSGIMPWWVRPASTSATTPLSARNISLPLASSSV
jgi:hypothetical protein